LLARVAGRVWEFDAAPSELPALRQRHRMSGVLRRAGTLQVRVLADRPPAPGARPATASLEEAYLAAIDAAPAAAGAPVPGGGS